MPYIVLERVNELDKRFSEPQNIGELNYIITVLMINYLNNKGLSYQNISNTIAAAQDAADEMKRRVLSKYEDNKIMNQNNVDPYDIFNEEIGKWRRYDFKRS